LIELVGRRKGSLRARSRIVVARSFAACTIGGHPPIAINTLSAAGCRERLSISGAQSDAGDARVPAGSAGGSPGKPVWSMR